jgi:hypothetical protein
MTSDGPARRGKKREKEENAGMKSKKKIESDTIQF